MSLDFAVAGAASPFFVIVSLEHLEHMPPVWALPKKPHPAAHGAGGGSASDFGTGGASLLAPDVNSAPAGGAVAPKAKMGAVEAGGGAGGDKSERALPSAAS